ncbi:AAA family ATPase, partial [Paenibacillus polymyxa]|uniref:AAA family ATPase n=1 Tax=Paenibacillus polymyxa TaxID=1406 RepID=UPI001BAEE858
MIKKSKKNNDRINKLLSRGITSIGVTNYKSLMGSKEIEIRPLTIIAGSNSSGKSSIIQPLLLIKQTLEQSYDPGALLLNGPNARFTRATEILPLNKNIDTFSVKVNVGNELDVQVSFSHEANKPGFKVSEMRYKNKENKALI